MGPFAQNVDFGPPPFSGYPLLFFLTTVSLRMYDSQFLYPSFPTQTERIMILSEHCPILNLERFKQSTVIQTTISMTLADSNMVMYNRKKQWFKLVHRSLIR